jgi:hypothetical protein
VAAILVACRQMNITVRKCPERRAAQVAAAEAKGDVPPAETPWHQVPTSLNAALIAQWEGCY